MKGCANVYKPIPKNAPFVKGAPSGAVLRQVSINFCVVVFCYSFLFVCLSVGAN